MRSCAHAIAGRPSIASVPQQRRPELELPRQPGLGPPSTGAQLEAGRALQVAVDVRDEALVAHGVVDPDVAVQLVRQRRLDRRPARCGRSRHAVAVDAVDGERAQPRPPLAVAVGVRERRPQLCRGHGEVPRRSKRNGDGTAPASPPGQAGASSDASAGAVGAATRLVVRSSRVQQHQRRAPHRGRAGDVDADEQRGDVVEVLDVADARLRDEHDEQQVTRCCTLARRAVAPQQPHHREHGARKIITIVPWTRATLGDAHVEARDVVVLAATAVRTRAGDDGAGDQHRGSRAPSEHPAERDRAPRSRRRARAPSG